MFDIHTHILPGIDDGSRNLQESSLMFDSMVSDGIKKIAATPHYYHKVSISEFLDKRNEAFKSVKNIEKRPEIALGAEVWLEYGMHSNTELRKLCIENTDYMLIELPFVKWSDWVYDELFKIGAKQNVNIIIAHIDRYVDVVGMDRIRKLRDLDLAFQVNIGNLGGFLKKSHAEKLMKKGLVDLIATDCHNMTTRKPCMQKAVKRLSSVFSSDYVAGLMNNAEKIFENKIL